jgi:uncharacterized protein (TIGR02145 family)
MRSFFLTTSFLLFTLFALKAQSSIQNISTFTDTRDNQVYSIITFNREVGRGVIHSHTWMTQNINYKMAESYCYYNDEKNCEKYGRLYTWKAAKDACPSGWHLPTDVEWQRLIHQFSDGGLIGREPANVYKALSEGGNSNFSALIGGNRRGGDGEFDNLGEFGFYWSAAEVDTGDVWLYGFDKMRSRVSRRDSSNKANAFSCRCIKD